MKYLDEANYEKVRLSDGIFYLRILPFQYLDGRNPRLPRKSSKNYKLMSDTKFYFERVFIEINSLPTKDKFHVEFVITCGADKLGKADLDNYCKAILDGVTYTQKVWIDDAYVDSIIMKRNYSPVVESSINLIIKKFG